MKYFLISDNVDTQIGMRLAGIEGVVVHSDAEVREAFAKNAQDDEIAILLVTEKVFDYSREFFLEHKINDRRPLIVEIPDRHGSTRDDNYILDYIKDAVGIKL